MANCNQPLAVISEFLREKQADGEITEQQNREQQSDQRHYVNLHGDLPQLLTGSDVQKRQNEECGGEQQHGYVLHGNSPKFAGAFITKHACITRIILSRVRFEYRKDFLNKV
jgi:hypothetical protein